MDRLEPCGLYIHIPFCLRKCSYCDFVSYRISSYDTARYCSAVVREMQLVLGSSRRISVADDGLLSQASIEGLRPTTVYIGGGTPTVLPVEQLGALITSIWRVVVPHQDYSECDIEFTVEANPETLSEDRPLRASSAGCQQTQYRVAVHYGQIPFYAGPAPFV